MMDKYFFILYYYSIKKKLFSSKELRLKLDDKKIVTAISHALSNEQRLDILKELIGNSANINELARKLDIPVSSVAPHVNVLEEAGLIKTEMQRGARGNMKLLGVTLWSTTFNRHVAWS